jgi:hypothetical protein
MIKVFGENFGDFLKNSFIIFFCTQSHISSKKPAIISTFFGENIQKIIALTPGFPQADVARQNDYDEGGLCTDRLFRSVRAHVLNDRSKEKIPPMSLPCTC